LLGECADHCAFLRIAGREIVGERPEEVEVPVFETVAMVR
jgi:hypothetical protein